MYTVTRADPDIRNIHLTWKFIIQILSMLANTIVNIHGETPDHEIIGSTSILRIEDSRRHRSLGEKESSVSKHVEQELVFITHTVH